MKHGYIKTAAFSPVIQLGDPIANAKQILTAINDADGAGVLLLVLPRMCLLGATYGDLSSHNVICGAVEEAMSILTRGSADLAVMTVLTVSVRIGTAIEECAVVLHRGEVLGLIPSNGWSGYKKVRAFGKDTPYGDLVFCHDKVPTCKIGVSFSPSEAARGATVTAVPMATPELADSSARRVASAVAASKNCCMVISDAGKGESVTDYVYGGHRVIVENGEVLAEGASLTQGMIITEADTASVFGGEGVAAKEIVFGGQIADVKLTRAFDPKPFIGKDFEAKAEKVMLLQAAALAQRIETVKAKCVLVGVSGGLDSTLAILAAVNAMQLLGRSATDVVGVTMPCFGTSTRTLSQAGRLMRALGVTQQRVTIKRTVLSHFRDIGHDPQNANTAYENAQARERTQVLMDMANDRGGFVVGTGDLSELVLGWTTFNGDHMSHYALNANLPKTAIKELVRYAARTTEDKLLARTLKDILDTPISPELLPSANGAVVQRTEASVGPYELHDFFIYYILGKNFTPSKARRAASIAFRGVYDRLEITKWLRVFLDKLFSQQFKRNCAPDGVTVDLLGFSPRAFTMPSDASARVWLEELGSDVYFEQ